MCQWRVTGFVSSIQSQESLQDLDFEVWPQVYKFMWLHRQILGKGTRFLFVPFLYHPYYITRFKCIIVLICVDSMQNFLKILKPVPLSAEVYELRGRAGIVDACAIPCARSLEDCAGFANLSGGDVESCKVARLLQTLQNCISMHIHFYGNLGHLNLWPTQQ